MPVIFLCIDFEMNQVTYGILTTMNNVKEDFDESRSN